MIKKIIHFSDLHLRLFKEHERYRDTLEECLEKWKKENPDRIVFTGDLVHSKNQMSPELINMVSWILKSCADICKTIILIGNHDFVENNQERLDALSPIIKNLDNPNIVYYKDTGNYVDENIMWCVYSLVDHNKRPSFNKEEGFHYIGLFHGTIEGSTTDLGFFFESGYSLDRFDGLDVVLAGDIHKRQVFDIQGGKKAYMVGSLLQQNFGETITNHGYGVYEVDTNTYNFIDVKSNSPYLNFKIKDITDIENGKEELTNL